MSGNHLKTPFNKSLNDFAAQKIAGAMEQLGKALPATIVSVKSGGIVEVAFQVNNAPFTLPKVTVPIVGSRYVQVPAQVGDLGMVISADARLGGVTGLGSGVANYQNPPGNLSALAFLWLGNTAWVAAPDPNQVFISGPTGALIQTDDGTSKVNVSESGVELTGKFGAFGTTPVAKPNITGPLSAATDTNLKVVVTSLIAALVALGLATNGTT